MQESGYSSYVKAHQHLIIGLCNNGQLSNAILVMEESLCKGFCPRRLVCRRLNYKMLTSNKVEAAYKLSLRVAQQNENARKQWHG